MGNVRKKTLTPALEDYLKSIYEITRTEPVARVKDIAKMLNVSLPSVTNALKRLKDLGFVNYEKYGLILLSEEGLKRAEGLEKIHCFLKTFFIELIGVPESDSSQISCKIEHYFEKGTEERVEKFINLLMNVKNQGESACKDFVTFIQER